MLILARRSDERVVVAGGGVEVVVTVVEIRPGMVRLGFDAPAEVAILRGEPIVADEPAAPTLRDEAAAVLVQLDGLAEVWGDEGVFRRCRDRLRAALAEGES